MTTHRASHRTGADDLPTRRIEWSPRYPMARAGELWHNGCHNSLEPAPMPPDDRRDDDDDPDLERFLADCRRFMAECPTFWIESAPGEAPALEAAEVQTDALVAEAHANRAGQAYPTAEQVVVNLPVVLRALCDHLLDVHPTAMDVARRLASVIDAVENVQGGQTGQAEPLH